MRLTWCSICAPIENVKENPHVTKGQEIEKSRQGGQVREVPKDLVILGGG